MAEIYDYDSSTNPGDMDYDSAERAEETLTEMLMRRGCSPACTRIRHVRECPNY